MKLKLQHKEKTNLRVTGKLRQYDEANTLKTSNKRIFKCYHGDLRVILHSVLLFFPFKDLHVYQPKLQYV